MDTKSRAMVRAMLVCLLIFAAAIGHAAHADDFSTLHWVNLGEDNPLPLVKITLPDRKTRLFFFDTGSPFCLIDSKVAEELHLKTLRITPNNPKDLTEYVICTANLGPGALSIPDVPFVLKDLSVMRQDNQEIAGILGMNLLSNYTVRMDYAKKQLDLMAGSVKGTANEPSLAIKLPLQKSENVYFLNGSLDKQKVRFRLDTGAEHTFVNEPDVLKTLKPKEVISNYYNTILTQSGEAVHSASGHLVRLEEMTLGKFTFPNPVIQREGLILVSCGVGNDVLQRFHLVMDFPDQTLYMTRDPEYREKPEPKPDSAKAPLGTGAPVAPIVLPFKTLASRKTPLVTASLNGGPPKLFVLNPGASACFIDQAFVQAAKIPIQKINTGGTTLEDMVVVDRMTFPAPLPLNTDRIPLYVMDLNQMRRAAGEDVIGVLGTNFLSAFKIRMDFSKQELTFYPKDAAAPAEKQAPPVPLQEEEGNYSLEAKVDGRPARLFVDFIQETNLQDAALLSKLQPTIKLQEVQVDGRKGDQTMRLKSIEVKGRIWSHPIVEHSVDPGLRVNLLGVDFFAGFFVTLDLSAKRLYLEPDPAYKENPKDSLGMGFHANLDASGILRVAGILVPGPATAAGLKAGDEILEINGQSTAKMPLATLFDSVRYAAGAPITVKIRHKGEQKPRELHWKITKLL